MGPNGKGFEDLLSYVHKIYSRSGRARIDKITVPVRKIGGKMFHSAKSTVDFTGVIDGGRFIAFDAKQTKNDRLPMSMLKQHQIDYLREINRRKGLGFFFVWFERTDQMFAVFPTDEWLAQYWDKRHSMKHDDLEREAKEIKGWRRTMPILDYLTFISGESDEY